MSFVVEPVGQMKYSEVKQYNSNPTLTLRSSTQAGLVPLIESVMTRDLQENEMTSRLQVDTCPMCPLHEWGLPMRLSRRPSAFIGARLPALGM